MQYLKSNSHIAEISKLDFPQEITASLIKKYSEYPKSSGRTQALRCLNGERLTPKQAILAECFRCSGGIKDCIEFTCPLYRYSPYKDKEHKVYDGERIQRIIKAYENSVIRSSGKTYYLRYLKDEKLTYLESILAKCAECTAGYADGRSDCENPTCHLHTFMPYRKEKP